MNIKYLQYKTMSKRSYSQPFGFSTSYMSQAMKRPRSAPRISARRASQGSRNVVRSLPVKARAPIPASLKRAVKAVIQNSKEQKLSVNEFAVGGASITGTNDITPIAPTFYAIQPQIAQGTSGANRVGSDITMVSHQLKYILRANLSTVGALVPQLVTLMIGKLRDNFDLPGATDYQKLLEGSAGKQGFNTTTTTDALLPINDDYWNVLHRQTFKLGEANSAASTLNNNDFNLYYSDTIDCSRFMRKKLVYDGAATSPANDGLYMFWFVQPIDGSGVSGFEPKFTASLVTRFTDA